MGRADTHAPSRPGKLRIIAGTLRNSRLDVPLRDGLRPTPGRVRETVFNWLAPVIHGARCLDLCAGTGALGIEALSRGAAEVTFVERDPALASALRANLDRLNAAGGTVLAQDARDYLGGSAHACGIVFMDPPFALGMWGELARLLDARGWLAAGALVYVETPRGADVAFPAGWRVHREGTAGAVHHALLRADGAARA